MNIIFTAVETEIVGAKTFFKEGNASKSRMVLADFKAEDVSIGKRECTTGAVHAAAYVRILDAATNSHYQTAVLWKDFEDVARENLGSIDISDGSKILQEVQKSRMAGLFQSVFMERLGAKHHD